MERRFGVPFPFTASMPKSSIEKVEGEKRLIERIVSQKLKTFQKC